MHDLKSCIQIPMQWNVNVAKFDLNTAQRQFPSKTKRPLENVLSTSLFRGSGGEGGTLHPLFFNRKILKNQKPFLQLPFSSKIAPPGPVLEF